jgi:hypothetical protein
MFAEKRYESKNPFNIQGHYILELLRNNSNINDVNVDKIKKLKPIYKIGFERQFEITKFNESICIRLD